LLPAITSGRTLFPRLSVIPLGSLDPSVDFTRVRVRGSGHRCRRDHLRLGSIAAIAGV
jgi:hypothetical protein